MSPRAAWRLERLGYETYDYVRGKMDWLAHGLPYEGRAVLVGDLSTSDVPVCSVDAQLSAVRDQRPDGPLGATVVVNDDDVVLGVLRDDPTAPDDAPVETLMVEGPTTIRPSEDAASTVRHLDHAGVGAVLVTRSDGTLLGVFSRDQARAALGELDRG